uniref:Cadherin domain-containing protein n=1 Tax=Anisakis simplex TaxID=6269 RepID=A0A0M3KK74_ANISI
LAEPYGRSATAAEQLQLKIDERSGEITLAESPDRELLIWAPDQSAIPFTVTASDGRLTAQHSGQITIVDRNDNAPRFLATADHSNHHHNTVQLKIWAPTTPLGGQLARLDAEDADSGWNAQIRYETDSEFFWIDPETGVLSYQKRLPEGTDQLQFHVTATDGGQPPLSTQLRVLVDVEHEEQACVRWLAGSIPAWALSLCKMFCANFFEPDFRFMTFRPGLSTPFRKIRVLAL